MAEPFELILQSIITLLGIGAFAWGIRGFLKKERERREEAEAEAIEIHDEALVKRIKESLENSIEVVRTEVADLNVKATKQLRRQNRRSDFTNSNVQKVRMDLLDHEQELYRMKKALAAQDVKVDPNTTDSLFERNILRKRTEIENDARQQLPPDDDD